MCRRAVLVWMPLALLWAGGCAHTEETAAEPPEGETSAQAQDAAEAERPQGAAEMEGEREAMASGQREQMQGEMEHGRMGPGMMAHDCPMGLEGTRVQVADVEGGVALHFSHRDPEQVEELQRRVREEAAMIAAHHSARHPPEGGATQEGLLDEERSTYQLQGLEVRVEEQQDGATLELLPDDPQMTQRLQERMNARAGAMQAGDCPMKGLPDEEGAQPGM